MTKGWAYGVTTVPERREDLLLRTLDSLVRAGFDRPRLFVDGLGTGHDGGPTADYRRFGLEVTTRWPLLRTAGNWSLALWELYARNPAADRYAIFQDDLLACRNLRAYLDRCAYPGEGDGRTPGYLNLYTFQTNEVVIRDQRAGTWHEAMCLGGGPTGQQTGRGAVALVFNRAAVVALLSSLHFVERPQDAQRGWRSIDGGIVTALNKAGYREYVHAPSLVQHVGLVSTMRNRPHRQAETWPGEDFDALRLLESHCQRTVTPTEVPPHTSPDRAQA